MLMVTSTLSQQAWVCGCLRNGEEPKMAKSIVVLPYRIVGFSYASTARGVRCSTPPPPPAASGYRMIYTNCNFQRMAASRQSRSEPLDNGSDTEDDGEDNEEDDEEEASADQVMFEENVEIMTRAAMNLFRRYSARAIRAIREISPPSISTELIAFGVKGAFCVGLLWVLKALLEVFCSVATYAFVGLLAVRLAWSVVVSSQPPGDSTWSPQGN